MFSYARTSSNLNEISTQFGFFALCGLSFAFGTMYLPAKKYNMGNGILFQWIICVAMAFFSFAIHLCVGSPKIWPLTVLAGCSWATGNVAVVAIVKRLGMGVGMLIWSSINLLVGWASCRFGWFGLKPEVPKNNTLNIVGVTLAVMSVFFYAFIKPPPTAEREVSLGDASAVDETTGEAPSSVEEMEESPHGSTADSVPLLQPGFAVTVRRFWKSTLAQRLIGILLAALSGLFYGVAFAPIIYVQENYHDASHRGSLTAVMHSYTSPLKTIPGSILMKLLIVAL